MDEVRILATGLGFPEGPVVLQDGSVILTEIRNNRCSRITPDGKVSLFSATGGGPNGLAVGPDGALYCCNNGGSRYVEGVSMGRPARPRRFTPNATGTSSARPTTWCSTRRAACISPISASATLVIAIMAASTTPCRTDRRSCASPTPC